MLMLAVAPSPVGRRRECETARRSNPTYLTINSLSTPVAVAVGRGRSVGRSPALLSDTSLIWLAARSPALSFGLPWKPLDLFSSILFVLLSSPLLRSAVARVFALLSDHNGHGSSRRFVRPSRPPVRVRPCRSPARAVEYRQQSISKEEAGIHASLARKLPTVKF